MPPDPLTPFVPHLTHLHSLLSLPSTALQEDLQAIDDALKKAVGEVVGKREVEVKEWEARVEVLQGEVKTLGEKLGEEGGMAVQEEEKSLPERYQSLLTQKYTLRTTYQTRLTHLQALQARLLHLSLFLGSSFPVPADLLPKATQETKEDDSAVLVDVPALSEAAEGSEWEDVGAQRGAKVEEWIGLCEVEKVARKQEFQNLLLTLLWLHFDLSLPSLLTPSSSLSASASTAFHTPFPAALLPPPSEASVEHQRILREWVEANKPEDEDEVAEGLKGVEIDPDIGFWEFCTALAGLWTEEKQKRQDVIQGLYDELEPIWARLGVEDEEREGFVERNRGLAEWVVKAYQRELERVTQIRKANLAGYIEEVRREIEKFWEGLMYSAEEKGVFEAMQDDAYSETLLTSHEHESARLLSETQLKAPLLPKVRAWLVLREEAEELERTMKDPMRFAKARGGAMLREERMRKRIEVVKPKAEQELLAMLMQWEEENDQLFFAHGERVLDVIAEDIEARELEKMEKEAKKKGRAPLSHTPARVPKPLPSKTPSSTTTTARKRPAPPAGTATPTPATTTKRPRIGGAESLNVSTSSNPGGGGARAAPPSCGLPRPVGRAKVVGRAPSAGALGVSGRENVDRGMGHARSLSGGVKGVPVVASLLGKDGGRRPRRESFKPRQSVVGRGAGLMSLGMGFGEEVVEEAEEEEEGDVF